MALLTAEEVAAVAPDLATLFDSTEAYEASVTFLLPSVEADFLAIRNRPFDLDTSGEPIYPTGAKAVALDMVRYRIEQARSLGLDAERSGLLGDAVTFTRDLVAGYPKTIAGRITRYIGAK